MEQEPTFQRRSWITRLSQSLWTPATSGSEAARGSEGGTSPEKKKPWLSWRVKGKSDNIAEAELLDTL